MPRTDHDLPPSAYVLIGLVVVGQDVFGLLTALLLALAFVGALIAASLVAAFVAHLAHKERSALCPRIWVGRSG